MGKSKNNRKSNEMKEGYVADNNLRKCFIVREDKMEFITPSAEGAVLRMHKAKVDDKQFIAGQEWNETSNSWKKSAKIEFKDSDGKTLSAGEQFLKWTSLKKLFHNLEAGLYSAINTETGRVMELEVAYMAPKPKKHKEEVITEQDEV